MAVRDRPRGSCALALVRRGALPRRADPPHRASARDRALRLGRAREHALVRGAGGRQALEVRRDRDHGVWVLGTRMPWPSAYVGDKLEATGRARARRRELPEPASWLDRGGGGRARARGPRPAAASPRGTCLRRDRRRAERGRRGESGVVTFPDDDPPVRVAPGQRLAVGPVVVLPGPVTAGGLYRGDGAMGGARVACGAMEDLLAAARDRLIQLDALFLAVTVLGAAPLAAACFVGIVLWTEAAPRLRSRAPSGRSFRLPPRPTLPLSVALRGVFGEGGGPRSATKQRENVHEWRRPARNSTLTALRLAATGSTADGGRHRAARDRPTAADGRHRAADDRHRTAGGRHRAADDRPTAAGDRSTAPDDGRRTAGGRPYGLPTTVAGRPTAARRLPATVAGRPTAALRLPTTAAPAAADRRRTTVGGQLYGCRRASPDCR